MLDKNFKTKYNFYKIDEKSYEQVGILDVPQFFINGYEFHVGTNAETKSEINIVKNKMYVPGKSWGYNDIQWTNFSGESLSLEIYSRTYEEYTGEETQPPNGGDPTFYRTKRTPHAVLKYWAQTFVTCHIETNLHAFESGDYKIEEFSQTQPDADFVITKLSFIQYERPGEMEQTYNTAIDSNVTDTSQFTAQAIELLSFSNHAQTCGCTATTDSSQCTASYNGEVEIIQKYLQQWGCFPSYLNGIGDVIVNGKFCYHTTQALRKFQEGQGIEVTGKFDETTKNRFLKKLTEI